MSASPPTGDAPRGEGARRRVEDVAPGAGELAGELARRLSTPGVVGAVIIAGACLAACLVVGLVTGLLWPKGGLVAAAVGRLDGFQGFGADDGVGAVRRVLLGTVGAAAGHNSSRVILPALFYLVPVAAGYVAARRVAPSLVGLSPRARIAWSAGGAVGFGGLLAIVGLCANDSNVIEIGAGTSFLAGTVTALIGVVPGALRGTRSASPGGTSPLLLAPWSDRLRFVVPSLRALAGLYLVALLVTTLVVEVQTARDQDSITFGRSVPGALVENVAYLPSFAVSLTASALLAKEQGGPTLPASDDRDRSTGDTAEGSVFSLNKGFPAYVYLPIIVVLLGSALLAALYVGFATARRAGTSTLALGAAYGALTGPVWALAMVVVREWTSYSTINGGGMVLWSLLGGAVVGAAGGALAHRPVAGGPPAAAGTPTGA